MIVSIHVIISFLISLAIYPFAGLYSIIFFLAGFLIDFDHCIEYSCSTKDLNPFNAYKILLDEHKANQKKIKKGKSPKIITRLHIFHTLEFVIFLGILSFLNKIIFFIFLGFFIHIMLDLVSFLYDYIRLKEKFSIIGREHFITAFLIKNYFRHKK